MIIDEYVLNNYLSKKHNILPNSQSNDLIEVVNNHVGLHSARIQTPFFTLCSRLNSFTPDMLISALYKSKELIKLRCMRTTLHIVSHENADILHSATLKLRIAECLRQFKKYNLSLSNLDDLRSAIRDFIAVNPCQPKILESYIEGHLRDIYIDEHKKSLAKYVLKYCWEFGDICYINKTDDWERENRLYGLTSNEYPKFDLNTLNEMEAQKKLAYLYIKCFGPVTLNDFSWWSGLSPRIMRDAVEENSDKFDIVHVEGFDSEFYILKSEIENIISFTVPKDDWVALLAYEDPSLKGYFESRKRFVNEPDYRRLFNAIGEARASIIQNGKVIGIWSWNKKTKSIELEFFYSVDKKIKTMINEIVERYEKIFVGVKQLSF